MNDKKYDLSHPIVANAYALKGLGMTEANFSELHHGKRRETYHSTMTYFSVKREIQPVNQRYGQRLKYAVQQLKSGRKDHLKIIEEAKSRHPF